MKRPSFQFYPGDWTANPNLRRCTFVEKGIWLEVLCLMHDQPEYGVLRWPLKEIAEAVKCRTADLQALVRKGVLKGHDKQLDDPFIYVPRSGRKDGDPVMLIGIQSGPIWYSSRMVKDEYVRTIRGESTRFGDDKGDASKHSPNPPLSDGASTPSSSSSPPSGVEDLSHAEVGDKAEAKRSPTPSGLVCKALKAAGLSSVNPSNQTLLALLDAGATTDELVAIVPRALDKDAPFAWLLSVAVNERKKASDIAKGLHRGPLPQTETAFARGRREMVDKMTGGRVSAKPPGQAQTITENVNATDPLALG